MSYFLGGLSALMGNTYPGTQHQDTSWCRKANRMDFSMNPWVDGGTVLRKSKKSWGRTRRGFWYSSRMASGDATVSGYCLLGQDSDNFAQWGEFIIDGKGNGSVKVVLGQVVNSSGAGISGATVKLFLTSNDAIVSTVGCDSNGNFSAPTPFAGQSHYATALVSGSPNLTGITINNLIPTNADGT